MSGGALSAGIYEVLFTEFAGNAPIAWRVFMDESDVERGWASPAAMADELVMARIHVGVHTRSAAEAGREVGTRVAREMLGSALEPF